MANQDLVYVWGLSHAGLPSALVDGMYNPIRTGRYGDVTAQLLSGAKNYPLADEGSYFSFCNPTAGTAIADGNASGFVTTTPTMVIFNSNPTVQSGGQAGKSIYMDFLSLIVTTAAGASSTNLEVQHYVDTGNRYTSGGTAITPANVNIGSSNVSKATIHFGAVTAPAANAQVQLHNEIVRTVIPVIGDKYNFRYGDTTPAVAGMPLEGTLELERNISVMPIVIPPQCSLCFYSWGSSQGTARQHTFYGGFWER